MPETANIIEVRQLYKHYRNVTAVDHISFDIPSGICFGILGPNGAGKTTTVEMMEKIIEPNGGEILYKGGRRGKNFSQEIGIQFQHTELLGFLTVEETLKTFAAFYDVPLDVSDVISMCMLGSIRKQLNNKISGGQRQRLLLGLALLNDPSLVFLDEPSTGLDPQARQHVWEIILEMKGKGKTIVLTTHYMEEAQHLCDEIAIMDTGKIIARGTPEHLIDTHLPAKETRRDLEAVFLELTGHHLRE